LPSLRSEAGPAGCLRGHERADATAPLPGRIWLRIQDAGSRARVFSDY
jgi:hypothetical protein